MNNEYLNTLLFFTIDAISKIKSSRASMWDTRDKYAYPPYFRFKLKEVDGLDLLYEKITSVVSLFERNFKWGMKTNRLPHAAYVIMPTIYLERIFEGKGWSKALFLEVMTEDEYKHMVDQVIDDVLFLAQHISKSFGLEPITEDDMNA